MIRYRQNYITPVTILPTEVINKYITFCLENIFLYIKYQQTLLEIKINDNKKRWRFPLDTRELKLRTKLKLGLEKI